MATIRIRLYSATHVPSLYRLVFILFFHLKNSGKIIYKTI